ncbi:S49 family peptidase [Abyssalbus ytuae]|uniref:S49 family peptidase n=1 Tax=Abyssalbus ytuae TaxID=2926907 RepID=A0A9E6ZLW1_9FLAO|nr:S49 family peptidase [Abyssalbus ytuae]UOB16590.1 S49 family peptidase [Abyssalbus ytuae]
MIFSRTASEILRGSWFIEPQTALKYLDVALKITSKKKSDFDPRPDAVLIREARTPEGKIISSEEDIPEGSIGIVSIMGPMIKYGDFCSWGADELVGFAEDFEANENIIGQIWRMDSGGGSVSSISPYLDFLSKRKKPVVAIADISASANYYVASATDYIMAENNISAMFGSIGVMIEFADVKGYYEKEGIKIHTIYADQSTHKNLPFEKALNGEYDSIKEEMLNPLAKQFQKFVKQHRKNLDTDVDGILNGRMFYADDALKNGLIDGIGNLNAAIEKVKLLAAGRSLIFS